YESGRRGTTNPGSRFVGDGERRRILEVLESETPVDEKSRNSNASSPPSSS
ncbi:hypothetical protein FGG08_006986, partial [Glutinoglossum americanum]